MSEEKNEKVEGEVCEICGKVHDSLEMDLVELVIQFAKKKGIPESLENLMTLARALNEVAGMLFASAGAMRLKAEQEAESNAVMNAIMNSVEKSNPDLIKMLKEKAKAAQQAAMDKIPQA